MTSTAIQNTKLKVENFEQVGNELATIRHLTAGNEAEVRRAHLEITMLKAGRGQAQAAEPSPQQVDLSPIIARLTQLEARPTGASSDETVNLIRALADEIATLNTKRLEDAKRIADLERTVGEIGAQFMSLAAKAA